MAPRTQGVARRSRTKAPVQSLPVPQWSDQAELVGLVFELVALTAGSLPAQYTVGLHAWFLDQIRQIDPELSAYLHDGESEKPFTLSGLEGPLISSGREVQLQVGQTYRWVITALERSLAQGLQQWLKVLLPEVGLNRAPLQVRQVGILYPAMTYEQIWAMAAKQTGSICLSFLTPTSFRRKGHHFPLPYPRNVFHSYLRRWNDFSGQPIDQDEFLDWVDDHVIIHQVQLNSTKVAAGKRGSVTGFTGAIELGLNRTANQEPEFVQLFYALTQLAPYCGTGHKTPFGLGQTQLGWETTIAPPVTSPLQTALAERIAELTEIFFAQRQRSGGERAQKTAETWATVLARRELGESLTTIAADLGIGYETAKTYVKLARRSLKDEP
ncbi:CRISPR-associated endoribonuclease Cas6 [Pantanalinema rosaneae CENA516]|uniref:CRISPR-associated endoribonuclease Cas6 n=1 Tax=Pantanalinema rosaneae TaxID=1620701 RepID=UPI003D6FC89A